MISADARLRSAAGDPAAGFPLAQPVIPAGPGQPPIIARVAWARGATPAFPPGYGAVSLAFVHHTVNPNGYSAAAVPSILYSMYLYHRYVRGWNDLGYNFVIDAYGRIWEGRAGGIDQAVVGAQAGGYNLESAGVAMLGTFAGVLPSPRALDALAALLAWKLALHSVPVGGQVTVEVNPSDAFYTPFAPGAKVALPRIAGHRDGCTTDCPGTALYLHLPKLRAVVAGIVPRAQSTVSLALRGGTEFPAGYLTLAGVEIVSGTPVAASGRVVTIAGRPIAGETVALQTLARGADASAVETTLAQASSAADGSFSSSLNVDHNLLLRAVVGRRPASTSPLIWIAVAPLITLGLPPYALEKRAGSIVVGGTVSPHKRRVTIEAYRHHDKQPLLRVTVRVRSGHYRARLKLKRGRYVLRAHTVADAHNIAGVSAPLRVTVP
jgi:N-acetylmuramoyl-L-alanine amidase-like protein